MEDYTDNFPAWFRDLSLVPRKAMLSPPGAHVETELRPDKYFRLS